MSAKQKAIELRLAGYSYRYIHEKTGLSKSTLSYHLATIPFEPNEYTLKEKKKSQLASAKTKHEQKLSQIKKASELAKSDIGLLTKRDLFIAGIALYIGEGSKTQNTVRLVNTDVSVICLFLRWLLLIGVPINNVVARIHGYPDTPIQAAKEYWSKATKIPVSQFQVPCIDTRTGKDRKRSYVHPYGTLHVTVRANGNPNLGATLARKIRGYMDELLG